MRNKPKCFETLGTGETLESFFFCYWSLICEFELLSKLFKAKCIILIYTYCYMKIGAI